MLWLNKLSTARFARLQVDGMSNFVVDKERATAGQQQLVPQRECKQRVARGNRDILLAVDSVRHRAGFDLASQA
jgi:hypothetical protein